MTTAMFVFGLVVVGRFVLPLLIPRYPLPAIIACLILDGVDQTIFQAFGYDPPWYQGYDKAMDLFYLAIAFLTTFRNWTRTSAVQVARFLFFYRMIGVLIFELTGWRTALLIFPNTFEYFFIFYEIVRLRYDPRRFSTRFWILSAAAIWIFIKLPQEYWIHVAQLDVTDTMANVPWFTPVLVGALVVLAAVLWFVVIPRVPAPSWSWRFSPEPVPEEMATAKQRDAWMSTNLGLISWWSLEKVALIALLSTVYARVLPGLNVSDTRMFVGVGLYVLANVGISMFVARKVGSREGMAAAFFSRVAVNVVLVFLANAVLGTGALSVLDTLFFVFLLSLLISYHDRYAPVGVVRAEHDQRDPEPVEPPVVR